MASENREKKNFGRDKRKNYGLTNRKFLHSIASRKVKENKKFN